MSFWLLVDVVSKTKPRALQGEGKHVSGCECGGEPLA